MKRLEKVKKGLQCCLPRDEEQCGEYPYFGVGCYDARIAETLECFDRLKAERDTLLKIVSEAGAACDVCRHGDNVGTKCEAADFRCKECKEDCLCKTCSNASNFEYKGLNDQGGGES